MKKLGVLLLLACFVASASEPVYQPYPLANITSQQWDAYYHAVLQTYGSSRRSFPKESLEVFQSSDNTLLFAFTSAGHPAHPAWITRRVVADSVNQIGYFAGKEEPFAELFKAYLALTDRTVESLPENVSTSMSFGAAKAIWEQIKDRKEYRAYIAEFGELNNKMRLDEKDGCYTLGTERLDLMLVITQRAGDQHAMIEHVLASVDTPKAACFKKSYGGVRTKIPPFYPFALQMSMG